MLFYCFEMFSAFYAVRYNSTRSCPTDFSFRSCNAKSATEVRLERSADLLEKCCQVLIEMGENYKHALTIPCTGETETKFKRVIIPISNICKDQSQFVPDSEKVFPKIWKIKPRGE